MGILANNDGKILRSNQTGGVIKQNYNFGEAFNNTNASNTYIDFPSLINMSFPSWSMCIFREGILSLAEATYEIFLNDGAYRWSRKRSNNSDLQFISPAFSGDYFGKNGYVWGSSDSVSLLGSSNGIQKVTETFPISDILTLEIGTYNSGQTNSVVKIAEFSLFSRLLSDGEINYYINNNLGNNKLNENDIVLDVKFLFAEIFDFGGTIGQAVGVRDFSGNDNHGRILNLPSGTLQEQLDYANANLFELW